MVQLEVLVAVDRQDREPVARAAVPARLHGAGQAQDPVAMGRQRGVVVLVVEADPVSMATQRRQEYGDRRAPSRLRGYN